MKKRAPEQGGLCTGVHLTIIIAGCEPAATRFSTRPLTARPLGRVVNGHIISGANKIEPYRRSNSKTNWWPRDYRLRGASGPPGRLCSICVSHRGALFRDQLVTRRLPSPACRWPPLLDMFSTGGSPFSKSDWWPRAYRLQAGSGPYDAIFRKSVSQRTLSSRRHIGGTEHTGAPGRGWPLRSPSATFREQGSPF